MDECHFELMRTLDPRSAIAIPLIARGETLGAMTFAWSRSGRTYSATDLPMIEDLGARAAVAVDNARLFQRERAAVQQLVFLAEVSTTLASSLDVETTLTNVAHLIVPQFADWCAVDAVDEDGAIRRLAVAHRDRKKVGGAIRSLDGSAAADGRRPRAASFEPASRSCSGDDAGTARGDDEEAGPPFAEAVRSWAWPGRWSSRCRHAGGRSGRWSSCRPIPSGCTGGR